MKIWFVLAAAIVFPLLAGCHAGGGPTLRVMSYNIRYDNPNDGPNRWSERREMLVNVIRRNDPDLLGTQEVLARQADYLREQLPGYGFVGVGRDDGAQAGEMTAIFYRSDRFDLLDSGHFWLSETPDVPGSKSWDAALTRMVSWIKVRDRRDDQTLWFFNTHFDHQGERSRAMSALLLRRQMRQISGGERTIITGDFNTSSDSAVSVSLRIGETGNPTLLDTYRELHHEIKFDEPTFNGFEGRETGPRIDWIIVTPDVQVIDAGIDRTHDGNRWPSDHYPVTATLRFPTGD